MTGVVAAVGAGIPPGHDGLSLELAAAAEASRQTATSGLLSGTRANLVRLFDWTLSARR
jgi:hypothetical protein